MLIQFWDVVLSLRFKQLQFTSRLQLWPNTGAKLMAPVKRDYRTWQERTKHYPKRNDSLGEADRWQRRKCALSFVHLWSFPSRHAWLEAMLQLSSRQTMQKLEASLSRCGC